MLYELKVREPHWLQYPKTQFGVEIKKKLQNLNTNRKWVLSFFNITLQVNGHFENSTNRLYFFDVLWNPLMNGLYSSTRVIRDKWARPFVVLFPARRGGFQSSTTMTSLPCSHSLSFLPEAPPQRHSKKILSRNREINLPRTNSSSGSSISCRNRNWVSRRTRFHAKPAKSEAEVDQNSQVAEEKITAPENTGTPSTSFLSVLCPLLKLFGVSPATNF